jgi:hypothetical protein
MDAASEAIEFGGLRVPSVMTESLEATENPEVSQEAVNCGSCDVMLCLFLVDFCDPEYRFFTDSGTPSHLELTLGTPFGSFWRTLLLMLGPDEIEAPPRSAACLRCASAYCSSATCEGSFSVKKPSTELAFFLFFFDVLESFEDPALEFVEA